MIRDTCEHHLGTLSQKSEANICSADLQQDPIKWHKKTTHCESFASFIGLFCWIWAKNLLENTKIDGNPCLRDVQFMAFSN